MVVPTGLILTGVGVCSVSPEEPSSLVELPELSPTLVELSPTLDELFSILDESAMLESPPLEDELLFFPPQAEVTIVYAKINVKMEKNAFFLHRPV